MKSQIKTVVLALMLTLGVCLLFPAVAAAQGEGQPCSGNPDQLIAYGNVILCSIQQQGSSGTFVFNGNAGDRVEVEAASSAFNSCVELVGVTTACSFNVNRNWIDTVLTTTKQYTIRVYSYYFNGTGNYTLDLESTFPHSPNARQTTYGVNLSDQISPLGDFDEFFFTASAGDVVDITAVSGALNPCIALYAPDAKTTWGACSFNVNRNEIRSARRDYL